MKTKLIHLRKLFWDYRVEEVLKNIDNPIIISRVLEFGNPEEFRELQSIVPSEKIVEFLKSPRAESLLSPRSLNFWRIYYGIDSRTQKRDN